MKQTISLLLRAILATLLGLGGALPATAQTYRIVGPDGKVTYSDRQPTDPQMKTRELGKRLAAPLLTPAREPFDLRTQATLPAGARGGNEGLQPAVDISGKPFPPGLPDAILVVVVHQFVVQSLAETCSRLRPGTTERFQGAVRNWRDRNADILAASNRITFARFTGEQRDTIRATARARMQPLLPAGDTPEADKLQWCDRTISDLARRQMELVGDARVAPIVDFGAP